MNHAGASQPRTLPEIAPAARARDVSITDFAPAVHDYVFGRRAKRLHLHTAPRGVDAAAHARKEHSDTPHAC